jgi:hypothetical protein
MSSDAYVLGQPRESRPAMQVHLPAGQAADVVLFTHFEDSSGEKLDHTAWGFAGRAGEMDLAEGSELIVGQKPEVLRLVLTAAQVEELGIGRYHPFQLRITARRPSPYFFLDEHASFLIVEDRYE